MDLGLELDPQAVDPLADVMVEAYAQSMEGKGKERHGGGKPFLRQPIMTITEEVGLGFPLGQALKKIQESQVLLKTASAERAVNELLGAIVYLAAAVLHIRGLANSKEEPNDNS